MILISIFKVRCLNIYVLQFERDIVKFKNAICFNLFNLFRDMHKYIFKKENLVINFPETSLNNILNIFILFIESKYWISGLSGLHNCMNLLILFINKLFYNLKVNIKLYG